MLVKGPQASNTIIINSIAFIPMFTDLRNVMFSWNVYSSLKCDDYSSIVIIQRRFYNCNYVIYDFITGNVYPSIVDEYTKSANLKVCQWDLNLLFSHSPWHDDKDYLDNVSYMFVTFYSPNAFNDTSEYLCIYRRPHMCSYTDDCNIMVCISCFDISSLQMCAF